MAKTFVAKRNGNCALTASVIVAGETEVCFLRQDIVLAQYAEKSAVVSYLNGLIEVLGKDVEREQKAAEVAASFGGASALASKLRQRIEWSKED